MVDCFQTPDIGVLVLVRNNARCGGIVVILLLRGVSLSSLQLQLRLIRVTWAVSSAATRWSLYSAACATCSPYFQTSYPCPWQ